MIAPSEKTSPGAATGWIDFMSLKAATDDLGNSPLSHSACLWDTEDLRQLCKLYIF